MIRGARAGRVGRPLGLAVVAGLLGGPLVAQFMTGKRIFDEQHREARTSLQASEMLEKVGFDQRLGGALPLETRWRDASGRELSLGEVFRGRPVLVVFGYYHCPVLCPLLVDGVAAGLKGVPLEPGKDYDVVFVSIDPADTIESAAKYRRRALERYGQPDLREGWHFLVGEAPDIQALTDAAGFRFVEDPATGEFAHAAGLVVTTPEGIIARYLFGVDLAPRDLKFSVLEASRGAIGTVADRILLLCFEYNEALGRYTAATFLWLRIGGALTFVALLAFIGTMLMRERRARPVGGTLPA